MGYYWIKLKNTFLSSEKVDFLMSQKDGANYIVLYQMLCLKTINTDGVLATTIGEIIVPYDCDKIARDCKYFPVDTVRVALELYKKLGMVYEEADGNLRITDFDNLVGSAKADDHTRELWAERKRRQRLLEKQERDSHGTVTETIMGTVTGHSHGDIRYIDNKDIEIIDNKNIDNKIIDNKIIDNKNNTEKEIKKESKHAYGEYKHVLLTDKELEKLYSDFGKGEADDAIKYLDEAIELKGYKYKNHNLALRKWVFDALKRDRDSKKSKSEMSVSRVDDFV